MNFFLDANICLDLLDTLRPTSDASVRWYRRCKDDEAHAFYFSGDFITTIYYVLTQKRKISAGEVIDAIDALCREFTPVYLQHTDFQRAKKSFSEGVLDDLEDLMVLHSALRTGVQTIITNDQRLFQLKRFENLSIQSP